MFLDYANDDINTTNANGKMISRILTGVLQQEIEREKYMDVAEDLYSKKIIEEDIFEDLQDTYRFSENHDYERDKDNFEMEI